MLSSVVMASLQSARKKATFANALQFERHAYTALYSYKVAEYDFSPADVTCTGNGPGTIDYVEAAGKGAALQLSPVSGSIPCNDRFSEDTPQSNSYRRSYYMDVQSSGGLETGSGPVPFSGTGSAATVSAWFKCPITSTANDEVWALENGAANTFSLKKNGTSFYLTRGTGGSEETLVTVPFARVCDSAWHHLLASLDSSEFSMYLDGAKAGSVPGEAFAMPSAFITFFRPTGFWMNHPVIYSATLPF
jgi:hypothetical protein